MTDRQILPDGVILASVELLPALTELEHEPVPRMIDAVVAMSSIQRGLGLKVPDRAIRGDFLSRAYALYRGRCECGIQYENNCAHYLTDAMVRAGLPVQFAAGNAKCPQGRLLRAKETLAWFRSFSTGFAQSHSSLNSGYWFVYQEVGGQGHVCIHHEESDKYSWAGTGDFDSWPVQWHFFY